MQGFLFDDAGLFQLIKIDVTVEFGNINALYFSEVLDALIDLRLFRRERGRLRLFFFFQVF